MYFMSTNIRFDPRPAGPAEGGGARRGAPALAGRARADAHAVGRQARHVALAVRGLDADARQAVRVRGDGRDARRPRLYGEAVSGARRHDGGPRLRRGPPRCGGRVRVGRAGRRRHRADSRRDGIGQDDGPQRAALARQPPVEGRRHRGHGGAAAPAGVLPAPAHARGRRRVRRGARHRDGRAALVHAEAAPAVHRRRRGAPRRRPRAVPGLRGRPRRARDVPRGGARLGDAAPRGAPARDNGRAAERPVVRNARRRRPQGRRPPPPHALASRDAARGGGGRPRRRSVARAARLVRRPRRGVRLRRPARRASRGRRPARPRRGRVRRARRRRRRGAARAAFLSRMAAPGRRGPRPSSARIMEEASAFAEARAAAGQGAR